MSMSRPPGSGDPSKVAIPRLPQKRPEPPRKPRVVRQDRANRACLNCRRRKIRCDSVTPKCSNCQQNAVPCVYASSRRDRLKTSTRQNQDMIVLLRELRTEVPDAEKAKIDSLLGNVADDVADAASTLRMSPEKHHELEYEVEENSEVDEANVTTEVGSEADLDLVDEDLLENASARATGFIGKASEIQWLRKMHTYGIEQQYEGPYGPPGQHAEAAVEPLAALRHRQKKHPLTLMRTSKASFYLDHEVVEMDFNVDPFELPPFELAEKLLQTFMTSCHNSLPFFAKKAFESQFYHYYAALKCGRPYHLPQKWQTQLNLVFAIAATYSHLISAEWRGDNRDHLIYHSRAWELSLKDPWWFSHPELPQMQITGLLSFYYLTIGHINRSWVLIGVAMRFGYALGLHIRNEHRAIGAAQKEVLARVWWSHYTLESLLSVITGRPSLGVDSGCSVPLPLPLSSEDIEDSIIESKFGDRIRKSSGSLPREGESVASSVVSAKFSTRTKSDYGLMSSEPANSGSYLKGIIKLSEVTQAALNLYAPSIAGESWRSVQQRIDQLTEKIELVATSLPERLSLFNRGAVTGYRYRREQNYLNMLFHSTKILITRPCLCRLDRRIKTQTESSNDFNQRAALSCIESAKSIANLLPDDPERNIVALYEVVPWWTIVHIIMQSSVVLLLGISYAPTKFPEDPREIMPMLKKLTRCLRAMKAKNRVAQRAYSIVIDLLKKFVATVRINISDILHEDEQVNAATAAAEASSPPLEAHDSPTVHRQTEQLREQSQLQGLGQNLSTRIPYQYQMSQVEPPNTTMNSESELDAYLSPQNQSHDAGNYSEANTAYTDWAMDWLGTQSSAFPGLLYTSFDEQNLLQWYGTQDTDIGGTGEDEDASQRLNQAE